MQSQYYCSRLTTSITTITKIKRLDADLKEISRILGTAKLQWKVALWWEKYLAIVLFCVKFEKCDFKTNKKYVDNICYVMQIGRILNIQKWFLSKNSFYFLFLNLYFSSNQLIFKYIILYIITWQNTKKFVSNTNSNFAIGNNSEIFISKGLLRSF